MAECQIDVGISDAARLSSPYSSTAFKVNSNMNHHDDSAANCAIAASRKEGWQADAEEHGVPGVAVIEEVEEFVIPIPTGLATKPRGNNRIWLAPSDWYSFEASNHAALAEEVRRWPMRICRPLYDWLRRNCSAGVRREYRLGKIVRTPFLAQARLTPVLVFADQTEAAMFRLAWC